MDSGKVDGERLCITGGSAGGYTTLAALAFRDTFKAGASLYGVSVLSYANLVSQNNYSDKRSSQTKIYVIIFLILFAVKLCSVILLALKQK